MKHVTDKKVLFVIQPQSIIDVITNSSSELFVFQGNDKEVIEGMISEIYPNYLDEYRSLVSLNELNDYAFDNYLSWTYKNWSDELSLSKKFNIAPEILYSNWDTKNSKKYWYGKLSSRGIALIKAQLPMNTTYLLYSIDENPNWEMQEALWQIGERYHLG